MLKLAIGNKAYSSWSLRPWLALRQLDVPFEEIVIPLSQPETSARIRALSPGGTVPVLIDGAAVVWETLAILEYLAELHPQLWPAETAARAYARSIASEMHAGFSDLRRIFPMNVRQEKLGRPVSPEVASNIARIAFIWRETRERYGASGPFLFGRFSAADAMFAPVATRFRTYGLAADDPLAQSYVEAIMSLPAMRQWVEEAHAESWQIEKYEAV